MSSSSVGYYVFAFLKEGAAPEKDTKKRPAAAPASGGANKKPAAATELDADAEGCDDLHQDLGSDVKPLGWRNTKTTKTSGEDGGGG